MLQRSSTPGLAVKAFQQDAVSINPKLLELDRHIPTKHHVMCRPDLTHSARPDRPIQPITTDQQHPCFHAYILLRMPPATRRSLNHWPCSYTYDLAEHLTATCTEAFCAKAAKELYSLARGSTAIQAGI